MARPLKDILGGGGAGGGPAAPVSGGRSLRDIVAANQQTAPAAPKHHHRGFFGNVVHLAGKTASDLEHVAINAPAGAVQTVEAAAPLIRLATGMGGFGDVRKTTLPFVKSQVTATKEVVEHPLRHPGVTLLYALPVASGLARVGEVAAGVDASAPRVLTHNDLVVSPETSRSALGRTVQRSTDTLLHRAAAKNPTGVGSRVLHRRIEKVITAEGKQATRVAKGPAAVLLRIGRRLDDGQQKALQVVAEQGPLEGRITAASARVVGAAKNDAARIRHQAELDLLHAAKPHLTIRDGKPALVDKRLQKVYDQMEKVARTREDLLKSLNLLTDESIQRRTTDAARISLGATYEAPTAAKLGIPSKALAGKRKQVEKLSERYDRLRAQVVAAGEKIPGTKMIGLKAVGEGLPRTVRTVNRRGEPIEETLTRARTKAEAEARLATLEKEHNKALDTMARAKWGPIGKTESSRISSENAKARRQQAGVDRLGRKSGASGPKSQLRKTMTEQRRAQMEALVEDTIAKNPEHPIAKAWRTRTNEIDALRAALTPSPEDVFGAAEQLHPSLDIHAGGQTRLTTAGEQTNLLPLEDATIPTKGEFSPAEEELARRQAANGGHEAAAERLRTMDPHEFEALAHKGTIGPVRLSPSELVDEVASGRKPSAILGWTDAGHAAAREAEAKGLHVIPEHWTDEVVGDSGTTYWIARDKAAADDIRAVIAMKDGPVKDIATGRVLGYSEADLAAYVRHNYGQAAIPAARATAKEEPKYGTVTETRKRTPTETTKRTVHGPSRVITPAGGARLERLGGHLSVLRDELARMEEAAAKRVEPTGILGHEDFTASPEAVRIPDVATRRGTKTLNRQGTVGAQGTVGNLKKPGSVTHPYTGALREAAVRRQDTTRLVAESGLEAAKYAGLKHVHELIRKAAGPEPLRPDDVAVRLDGLAKGAKLPPAVAKFIGDPEEYFKARSGVDTENMLNKARSMLFFPTKDWKIDSRVDPAARAEFERLSEEGKIGWVPKRLLGELAAPNAPLRSVVPGKAVSTVDLINNASRFAILYLKPAYAVPNILGNAALNIVQQGFAAPRNLAQAAKLYHALHPDDYATIDAGMGEGAARAIGAEGLGPLASVVDKAASWWSVVVDTPFRRASFIHEARRAGYKTPEQIHELLSRQFDDPELVKIGVRANRDIIDYENLSPVEREVVRRVIFFYPWVKGSTVYAGRFLREHPVQAAAVGALGASGQKFSEQGFGGAPPSYLEGLIPLAGGTKAVNPSAATILQTPAQVAMVAQGLASGHIPSAAEASNLITPALALALAETQRVNPSTGVPYKPGTSGWKIAQDQLTGHLPQVQLANALMGRSGRRPLYRPSTGAAVGKFFFGGLYPRKIDRNRLHQLARSEERRTRSR